MIISKFYKEIELYDNEYAIYNNLYMNIIFVDKIKLNKIKEFNVTDEERKELIKSKIYIEDELEDENNFKSILLKKDNEMYKIKTMYLCVTNECNLRCKYCFINNQNEYKNGVMSENVAIFAIDKFSEYLINNNIIGKLIFYGGEH